MAILPSQAIKVKNTAKKTHIIHTSISIRRDTVVIMQDTDLHHEEGLDVVYCWSRAESAH